MTRRTALDYHREIAELNDLVASHRELVGPAPTFADQLHMSALEARLGELVDELASLGDADIPIQQLDVILRGDPVHGNRIEATFLSEVLQGVQRVVRSVVGESSGRVKRAGRYPEDLKRLSTLQFAATFSGSFGMTLEAGVNDELELPVMGALTPAISRFVEMLQGASDPERALEAMATVSARTRQDYRSLLERLAAAHSDITVRWPNVDGVLEGSVNAARATQFVEVLSRLDEQENQVSHPGQLTGVIRRSGYFEFEVKDGPLIKGHFDPDLYQFVTDFMKIESEATFMVRTITDRGTGDVREAYTLIHLAKLPDTLA